MGSQAQGMVSAPAFSVAGRSVGAAHAPLVIAEIGINHEGSEDKAHRMVDDAARAGCECVKFQTHVVDDEMIENDVVPGNATESIWTMMKRCALSPEAEARLKTHVEEKGMIFLSTPFSRAAADRLRRLDIAAYKIGSGECNNYPLIDHIAGFGKPVILSTGMNDIPAVGKAVAILRRRGVPFALMHCTSVYPTPYSLVRLGAMAQLRAAFPDAVVGLSDHSPSIYPCLGAVSLGAAVLERHFTSDKTWPGPDIPVSMDPDELGALVAGSRAIHASLGGEKTIVAEEAPTIAFAYASVVTIADVKAGQTFDLSNLWAKRPGTGAIRAERLNDIIGRKAKKDVPANTQLDWDHVS